MKSQNGVELMRQQLDAALRAFDEPDPSQPAPGAPTLPVAPAPDLLRTVARLAIGTLLLTADTLAQRAAAWELLAAQRGAAPPILNTALGAPAAATDLAPADAPPDPATLTDNQIVLAAIGWASVIPDQLRPDMAPRQLLETIRLHLEGTAAALGRGSLAMASRGLLGPPAMIDDPVIQRWVALGQSEASHSRALARVAIGSLIQEAIEHLAGEPAVQQIVQQQGTTLAGDVLGEVREYTVSGDAVVDGLVRRVFGGRHRRSGLTERPAMAKTIAAIDEQ